MKKQTEIAQLALFFTKSNDLSFIFKIFEDAQGTVIFCLTPDARSSTDSYKMANHVFVAVSVANLSHISSSKYLIKAGEF